VKATELQTSTQGVKLYAPELGPQYNVVKLPVAQGFLLLENRTATGYDASIPFCNDEAGGLFVDDIAQYLQPLALVTDPTPPTAADMTATDVELCDVYALKGHHDTFTYGGWKISNVSQPGPVMTLDIEKLAVTPTIDHYRFDAWFQDAGKRVRHHRKLEGTESTIDYSTLDGGTSVTGFVSIGIDAYYNTGERRGMALDTTYTSDNPYLTFDNAGKFTNPPSPTPDSLTYATIHADQPYAASVKVTFKTGTFTHTINFTNLPQN
jgi:hypothetical protein